MDVAQALLSFVAIFLVMFVVWTMTGGPARFERENQGILMKPLTPSTMENTAGGGGETYGNLPKLKIPAR